MEENLLKLSTEEKPVNRRRLVLIQEASPETIDECIKNQDCQEWFLEDVFKSRYDNSHDRAVTIFNHPNCPYILLALAYSLNPSSVEDAPGMKALRLSFLEKEEEVKWKKAISSFSMKDITKVVEFIIFQDDIRFMKGLASSPSDALRNELLRRMPSFVIEHYLQYDESQEVLSEILNFEMLRHYLGRLGIKHLSRALQRVDVPEEILENFAGHEHSTIRKIVANHSAATVQALKRLSEDKNPRIASAALARMPEDLRKARLAQKKSSDIAKLSASSNERALLLLRLPKPEPEDLVEVVNQGDVLLACAATLHPCANEDVLEAFRQLRDAPLWAKVGLAMRTPRRDEIDGFIKSGSRDVLIALSGNHSLDIDQSGSLLEASPTSRVLANLSDIFIDYPQKILSLISRLPEPSALSKNLKKLLSPETSSKDIKSIHGAMKEKYRVLNRLIARHPNCPQELYWVYAFYLPDDLARNAQYSLAVLESAKAAKASPFEDWKYKDYFDNGHAPEYLCFWALLNDDIECQRKAISATYVDPNLVRHMAVLDDGHIHRRFVHARAQQFGEYEYRMLCMIGTPSVRRAVISQGYASDEMLHELAKDTDKLVAGDAIKIAGIRNLDVGIKNGIDKTSVKGLGNKAARIELARNSNDPEILALLSRDKLADVRAEVATRRELSNERAIGLLDDPEKTVISGALYGLLRRELSRSDDDIVQGRLEKIARDGSQDMMIRARAVAQIHDSGVRDGLYRKVGVDVDNEIIRRTVSGEIIEDAFFRIGREEKGLKTSALASNPNLSVSQCDDLVRKYPHLYVDIASGNSNENIVLHIIKTFPDHPKRHEISMVQKFSSDQVDVLYRGLGIELAAKVLYGHLSKLPEVEIKKIFDHEIKQGRGQSLMYMRDHSDSIKDYVFQHIIESKDVELLEEFCSYNFITDEQFDQLCQLQEESLLSKMANNAVLTEKQIRYFEASESLALRKALWGSWQTPPSSLSTKFIQACASFNKGSRQRADEELRRRGEI